MLELLTKTPPASPLPTRSDWEAGPLEPELAPGEVHVWRAALERPTPDLLETLSPAEWVRARRFHQESDRQRFIAAHGLTRCILARYLAIDPADVEFGAGQHGKPFLARSRTGIQFNLSHSDSLMLLAVARDREVGVDVEYMRDNVPFESLAEHYFEPSDAWTVRTAPVSERAGRFYQMWTNTEARLKALGTGFLAPDLSITPERWSLLTLHPAAGYAATLAVEGSGFDLHCWSWLK